MTQSFYLDPKIKSNMFHESPSQPEWEIIVRFIENKEIEALSSLLAIQLHKYDKKKKRWKYIKSAQYTG